MKPILLIFLVISFSAKGQYFEAIGNGIGIIAPVNSGVEALCSDTAHHLLVISGDFSSADGVSYNGICFWNGTSYGGMEVNMGNGLLTTRAVNWGNYTVVSADNKVYIYDSTHIIQILPAASYYIEDLIIYNNQICICGAFDIAGGVTVNCIAKWNGSAWESIGGGLTGSNSFSIQSLGIL